MFCTPCVIEMPAYGISPSWDYGVVWQSMLSWTAIDIAESSCMPTLNPVACRRWIQLHADAESSCMPTLNPVACRRWIQLHADAESSCMPTYMPLWRAVCVCYYECCFTTMATFPAFVGDLCTVSCFAHAWTTLDCPLLMRKYISQCEKKCFRNSAQPLVSLISLYDLFVYFRQWHVLVWCAIGMYSRACASMTYRNNKDSGNSRNSDLPPTPGPGNGG